MLLSHFDKEEQALIIYFKQMLDKYDDLPPESASVAPPAESEQAAQLEQPLTPPPSPHLQKAEAPEPASSRPVAFAGKSLEILLEAVEPHTETAELEKEQTEVQTLVPEQEVQSEAVTEDVQTAVQTTTAVQATEAQTEVQTAEVQAAEVQTTEVQAAEAQAEIQEQEVQTATATEEVQAPAQAEVQPEAVKEAEQLKAKEEITAEEAAKKAEDESLRWSNIETDAEFQALFFIVKGVRFAVPLVDLGGIYTISKPLTEIFGKPIWYRGMMDLKGKNINVVDTIRWVKPDAPVKNDYKYIIVLGSSLWSVGCDELEGNRFLKKDSVKWRQSAGGRPWLAGIVKEEMCALLHVKALIAMFEKGFELSNIVS